jgi:hypothetical protein
VNDKYKTSFELEYGKPFDERKVRIAAGGYWRLYERDIAAGGMLCDGLLYTAEKLAEKEARKRGLDASSFIICRSNERPRVITPTPRDSRRYGAELAGQRHARSRSRALALVARKAAEGRALAARLTRHQARMIAEGRQA